jgi:hypothetical protein
MMNKATVLARLDQVGSGPLQLERVCRQVATELIEAGSEPDFAVTTSDFHTDPRLLCADNYWSQRLLADPTITTAAACARWLQEHVELAVQPAIEQRWALGTAYITRDIVETPAELAAATARLLKDPTTDENAALFATLYHAGKFRANRSFDDLRRFLDSSALVEAAGARRGDPVLTALQAMAAFGSRAMTTEHAIELLKRAWDAPTRTYAVTDLCLQAISDSLPFDGQGSLLVEYASQAVQTYRTDSIFSYRLASGLHMCQRSDEALAAIDEAIRLQPTVGGVSHQLFQQQYLSKREAILEGRLRAQWAAEQQQRWEQQEQANAAIRETVQSSTVRAVELVAIFTAAIAFAVGSLQVTLNGNLQLRDRVWLVVALGAGLAVFALLTIGGTWFITGRRPRPPRSRR